MISRNTFDDTDPNNDGPPDTMRPMYEHQSRECPYCGGEDLRRGLITQIQKQIAQHVRCENCGKDVGAVFVFAYFAEMEEEGTAKQEPTKTIERRLVEQQWYEFEYSETGWKSHGWTFSDSGYPLTSDWTVIQYTRFDKDGNPWQAIAEREVDLVG